MSTAQTHLIMKMYIYNDLQSSNHSLYTLQCTFLNAKKIHFVHFPETIHFKSAVTALIVKCMPGLLRGLAMTLKKKKNPEKKMIVN